MPYFVTRIINFGARKHLPYPFVLFDKHPGRDYTRTYHKALACVQVGRQGYCT